MKSIQGRLILTIVAASLALLSATGLFLYQSIYVHLVHQFDGALEGQASSVSSFVNLRSDGSLDFDYSATAMSEYRQSPHAQYFVIRFADGRVFAKSESLKDGSSLQVTDATQAHDVMLPTGRVGRAMRLDFFPPHDPGDHSRMASLPKPPAMMIVVARDRATLDGSLRDFLSRLIFAMTSLAALNVIAVVVIVRWSLRPLRSFANYTQKIGPDRLHLRLPATGLPAELSPICFCVNELLDRLDQAFKRERRFTSDVAHELRTPIAELRSLAEVASKYPNDPEYARNALYDAVEIAKQMQSLVTTLLALVRSEQMPSVALEPVRLRVAVTRAQREMCIGAEKDRVVLNIPDDSTVMAEPHLLSSILRNVLSNAVEYSVPGTRVLCRVDNAAGHWTLWIENQTDRLTVEDLPHLFEPFWRKDAARTDTVHAGLGLSLVSAYCQISGIAIEPQLRDGDMFVLKLTIEESTEKLPDETSKPSDPTTQQSSFTDPQPAAAVR